MSKFGIIGDLHGNFTSLLDTIKKYPDIDQWLQVGDLGGESLPYPVRDFPENFSFIQGNHENWDIIYEKKPKEPFRWFLTNGTYHMIKGQWIATLGGNYSRNFYEYKREDLPQSRKRHFVKKEVDEFMLNLGTSSGSNVDILLTHEAPSPFINKSCRDVGQPIINDVLKALKPKIHFFGHHHYYCIGEYEGIVSVGVEYGYKSFVIYNTEDHKIDRINL